MRWFAVVLAAAAVAAVAAAKPALAEEPDRPWCAELALGDDMGAENCGFHTLEQCREAVSGVGGYCKENPLYRAPAPEPERRERRSPRQRD